MSLHTEGMATEQEIRQRYTTLLPHLNERARRLLVAADALEEGRGGVSKVARAAGISRETVYQGLRELAAGPVIAPGRIRQPGGGNKRAEDRQPGLLAALEALVAPVTRGDPMSPVLWTSKSGEKLAAALRAQGFQVCGNTVRRLLKALDYSLQAPAKVQEGGHHPDRDAQFEHIATTVQAFQAADLPVISVDGKKKELVGEFRTGGREYRPVGMPEEVNVYDFLDAAEGKAVPYGVYDVGAKEGWVSVGIDHDTATFAVATIRTWWRRLGQARYPDATHLLICADGGGSNGVRCKLWKCELQRFADETGLALSVCHLPPGTSKWNQIEHRLFAFITMNWRGKPLVSYEMIVQLIRHTTTTTGLRVDAALDVDNYPTGKRVSAEEWEAIQLLRDTFHGEWNYTILPYSRQPS